MDTPDNNANQGGANSDRKRTHGFRLSVSDVFVLLIGGAIAGGLWRLSRELSLLVLMPLTHFFLFCNVFRVRRKPECIWAGVFVVNMIVTTFAKENYGMLQACLVQLILTAGILIETMRRPDYHGILSERINPDPK